MPALLDHERLRQNIGSALLPMKKRVRSNQNKWEYSLGSDAIEALYQLS